jgi:hypothetical protein
VLRRMKSAVLLLAISGLLPQGACWTCYARESKVLSKDKGSEPVAEQRDGQESEDIDGPSNSNGASKSKAGVKLPKRPAYLRLPRYFAGLVDEQQRSQIQEIQLQFRSRITKLERELGELKQEEQQAIEQVLTPAQRKLLDKKRLPSAASGVELDPSDHVDPSSDRTPEDDIGTASAQ